MRTKSRHPGRRRGFSLLELTTTTALLALISTASVVLVRTSYSAWNRHEDDNSHRHAASAVVRHLSRKVRQARAVVAVTPSTDLSGSISLLMPNGDTLVWEHDAGTNEVRYGVTTASDVVADEIQSLQFFAYNAAMATTADPGLVHSVMVRATVSIARPAGSVDETFSGFAHVKSW